MLLVHSDIAGFLLIFVCLFLLGTWHHGIRVYQKNVRVEKLYIDFGFGFLALGILVSFVLGNLGPDQPDLFSSTDFSAIRAALAFAGGASICLGNLLYMLGAERIGMTVAMFLRASIGVLGGASANYALNPEKSNPVMLFSGVGVLMVAIVFCSLASWARTRADVITVKVGPGGSLQRGVSGAYSLGGLTPSGSVQRPKTAVVPPKPGRRMLAPAESAVVPDAPTRRGSVDPRAFGFSLASARHESMGARQPSMGARQRSIPRQESERVDPAVFAEVAVIENDGLLVEDYRPRGSRGSRPSLTSFRDVTSAASDGSAADHHPITPPHPVTPPAPSGARRDSLAVPGAATDEDGVVVRPLAGLPTIVQSTSVESMAAVVVSSRRGSISQGGRRLSITELDIPALPSIDSDALLSVRSASGLDLGHGPHRHLQPLPKSPVTERRPSVVINEGKNVIVPELMVDSRPSTSGDSVGGPDSRRDPPSDAPSEEMRDRPAAKHNARVKHASDLEIVTLAHDPSDPDVELRAKNIAAALRGKSLAKIGSLRSRPAVGIALCLFAGFTTAAFSPLFNLSTNTKLSLGGSTPLTLYGAFISFAVGYAVVSTAVNAGLLRFWPLPGDEGQTVGEIFSDWWSIPARVHLVSFVSGIACAIANIALFLGGSTAGYAASLAISQCNPLVGSLWGIFYWHEFTMQSPPLAKLFLAVMVLLYLGAIVLIVFSIK